MKESILVTGATGIIGCELVKYLHSQGTPVRIAIHNQQNEKLFEPYNKSVVKFEYESPSTFERAFEQIESFFLSVPMGRPNTEDLILPAISAAKECGVKHIVSLGALGVELDSGSTLSITEKCVQSCGLQYTILRPNLLMQNFETLVVHSIKKNRVFHLPAGNAEISFVDGKDVAEAAAEALLNLNHRNKIYTLTGKEALDHYQIARVLSMVTGQTITYVPVSHNKAEQELLAQGWSIDKARLLIGLYEIARHGWCKDITSDLAYLLDREPTSFEQFAWANKESWI